MSVASTMCLNHCLFVLIFRKIQICRFIYCDSKNALLLFQKCDTFFSIEQLVGSTHIRNCYTENSLPIWVAVPSVFARVQGRASKSGRTGPQMGEPKTVGQVCFKSFGCLWCQSVALRAMKTAGPAFLALLAGLDIVSSAYFGSSYASPPRPDNLCNYICTDGGGCEAHYIGPPRYHCL